MSRGAWDRLLVRLLGPDEAERVRRELDEVRRHRAGREGPRAADRARRRELRALVLREAAAALRRGATELGTDAGRGTLRTLRSLRRAPAFTVTAVATLAVGIAADALVFGVVDGVVFRPLPYREPDRLVAVWAGQYLSVAEVEGIRTSSRTLTGVGGWMEGLGINMESDGDPRRLSATRASPELFDLLGVVPAAGGLLPPTASEPGRDEVVVLEHAFWLSRFGGDPAVVGATLPLDGRPHRVVGVLPEGVEMPWPAGDVVLPLVVHRSEPGLLWGSGGHRALGRLAEGATADEAEGELRRVAEELRRANPLWTPPAGYRDDARVLPLDEALVGDVRTPLLVLLAAVGVVLLVVVANVANLMLSRGLARRGEVALRAALGAGRARLVREQVVEGLLLAAAGAGAGVALARVGLDAIRPWLPPDLPRAASIDLDGRVILAVAGVAAVVGVATGLVGALRGGSMAPADALRAGGRGSGSAPARRRLSRALVGAQVAAAVVLVASASLLARTLSALSSVDAGFRPEGVVSARVDLSPAAYPDETARRTFHARLERELEALGELRSVALAGSIPFGPTSELVATFIDGVTDDPNVLPTFDQYRVTPRYFETLGIPLLEGRGFEAADEAGAELVAIVDRTAAERFWPEGGAVGRVIRYPWRGAPPMRVVGVAGAVADDRLAEPPSPTFYVPLAQHPSAHATVLARAAGEESAALVALERAVTRLDPRVPVSSAGPYARWIGVSLARERLMAAMLVFFAGAALVLGGVGVYGVTAASVRERTRDFGVRMALGARGSDIRRAVLGDVARFALPGLVVGSVLAALAARGLRGLLHGVAAVDPVTVFVVPLVLGATVLIAVAAPAVRAARVDPAEVLGDA